MSSLNKIYRGSVFYLFYPFFKIVTLLAGSFHILTAGYKRSVVGTCTIFAPPKQTQIILEGITYLGEIDQEMFKRLTVERKYVFLYHKKQRVVLDGFNHITDDGLRYGKEGVAICLVQTILFRDVNDSLGRFGVDYSKKIASQCDFKQQIFEFVKKRSFSPKLVEHFQKTAEKARGLKNKQDDNQ